VQLLRALAALLVLFGHVLGLAAHMGHFKRPPLPTGIGVDLFFAISGFIMVFASDRLFRRPGAGRDFLIRRIMRVVPLYWLTTTAMLALLALGSRGIAGWPSAGYILSSYLFVPDQSFGSVGGLAFPLLSVGWTLNYEMVFYLVFSAFLALPRHRATGCTLFTLAAGVALGAVAGPRSAVLSTWTQPIVLEFGLGLLIGNALLDGWRLPRTVALLMLVAACVWTLADPCGLFGHHQTPSDYRRLFGWGLPAATVLAAVVLGLQNLPAWCERPAALLGDASYSLYLTHPFILIVGEQVWQRIIGPKYLVAFMMVAIITAMAVSIGVNKVVERPFTRVLQRFRNPSTATRSIAPA
jgi:peptidoglycan/LPS O-acetylase OafA/YrhL